MMIYEKHKHLRVISYRWLVTNALWQLSCLILITLTVFLTNLVIKQKNGVRTKFGVLFIDIFVDNDDKADYHYFITDFRPRSDICEDQMAKYSS